MVRFIATPATRAERAAMAGARAPKTVPLTPLQRDGGYLAQNDRNVFTPRQARRRKHKVRGMFKVAP